MSYASANQNHENRFDLSETFLKKAWKNLNESLDTKECILPDRRRANLEEAERVIRELPQAIPHDERNIFVNSVSIGNIKALKEARGVYTFKMRMGLHKMEEVLQKDFIAGWDSMHLYDCMSDSFELTQIVSNSANVSEEKPWRVAVQLRLEEKLIASKRASYNVDRVHNAYCNVALLVNNMVTPNGSYDSLYLSETLFPKSNEIDQTYTRISRHIKKYMENIDGLLRSYIADGHVAEIILNCNQILEVSVEYERDMTLYESLVIRQPLQRIIDEKNHLKELHKDNFNGKVVKYLDLVWLCLRHVDTIIDNLRQYDRTHANDTISSYLQNLKNETNVSRLSVAAVFTSDKILKLVEKYQDSVMRQEDNIRELIDAMNEMAFGVCDNAYSFLYAHTRVMLSQWLTKQNDHYNNISDYEKTAMERYFMPDINSSIYRRMLRRDWRLRWDCHKTLTELVPSYNFTTLSLRQLTTFKNKLESFLRKSRLDGTFFRYVSVV